MVRILTVTALLMAFVAGAWADERELEERMRRLNTKDMQQVMELAEWCMQREMWADAKKLAEMALAIDKRDPGANQLYKEASERAGGGGDRPHGGGPGEIEIPRDKPRGTAPNYRRPKKPSDFRDGRKLGEYVESLFAWGGYYYHKGDKDKAKRYWSIILDHYGEAHFAPAIRKAMGMGGAPPIKHAGGDNKKPDDGGFKSPADRLRAKREAERKAREEEKARREAEKKAREAKKRGEDEMPDGPGEVDKPGKPGKGDEIPDGPGKVNKPVISGPDKKKPEDKPGKPDKGADPVDIDKVAKAYKAKITIESVRINSWQSNAGTYPQIELRFTCSERATKPLTLEFFGKSKKGKGFYLRRVVLPPDPGEKHCIVAAYDKKWVQEHGQLTLGRVEIHYGNDVEDKLVAEANTGRGGAPKWWEKIQEGSPERFGRYKVRQNPTESGTLRWLK